MIKEMEINCLKHFDQSIFIPNSDSKIINILVQGQNAIRFKNSSYGIRWLRENDPIHKDTATGQRLSSPPNENRLSIEFDYVKEKGTDLIIKWSDKQDESIYSDSWLKHCVSLASAINSKYDNIAQPWLNSQWNIQGFRFDKTYSERDIIDCLQKSGVVLLQNIQHEKLVELAESFGPIYTTEYGKTHPSIAKPLNGIPDLSLSNSGCALSLHTDSTFRETPKLLQWLYCVENKAKGGESIISDSRIAIDILKSEHTNAWNMLTSKTVQFYQYNETQRYIFSRNCPIIEVDDKTSDHKVNVSHKNLEWLLVSPDAEEWFSAYTLFFEILNSDRCSVRFRLKKGDCLIIQNWRILHARDTFEPDSGHRELDVFYQAWNYLEARRNFIDFHGFVDN
ncbi:TauD/TfdA family dioxygenase [Vibrio metschnikovii]|uniref:TauD/TfdA family dioxygenase n=1 Tax=Vibrio metschnikovii TaxID=28172 RepID=UPI00332D3602